MPGPLKPADSGPIKSPKSTESDDGILKRDSTTMPKSANKKN